jgi:monoamine oxidase
MTTPKGKKKYTTTTTIYDTIIVGGGIGGLYTAYKLQQKHNENTKTHNILLLEGNNRLGGRIYSITKDDLTYEAGAARFHNKQHKIMDLIKELKLKDKLIILSNNIKFISTPKDKYLYCNYLEYVIYIERIINDISDLVKNDIIKEEELINNSLLDIIDTHFNKKYPDIAKVVEDTYEYWSEIAIMNAKDALKLFQNDFTSNNIYYSLYGGLGQLIEQLEKKLKIDIETDYQVKTIIKNPDETFTINNKYTCRNLVLAIPKHNLLELDYLTKNKDVKDMLNSVVESPLCRIYAKYPKTILNYQTWFNRLPKVTLPGSRLKYSIPISYPNGLIMISYTDGKYAEYWKRIIDNKNNNMIDTIYDETIKTFAHIENIPKPDWTSEHYWEYGVGYWKVGIDSDKIISKILKPIKKDNIFICGENYSKHQAWIEGALDTAHKIVNKII